MFIVSGLILVGGTLLVHEVLRTGLSKILKKRQLKPSALFIAAVLVLVSIPVPEVGLPVEELALPIVVSS